MNNRLIVPAGVLMAAVLIIAGGYVILIDDKQSDKKPAESSGVKDDKPAEISENDSINQNDSGNNNPEENPYLENVTDSSVIEYTEREIKLTDVKKINTLEDLEPTAELQLKVGETYIYHVSDNFAGFMMRPDHCNPVEIDIPVHIEKIERINKSDYYVLKSERYERYPVCYITIDGNVEQIYLGKPRKPGDRDDSVPYGGCAIGINKDNPLEYIRLAENFARCDETVRMQEGWMLYLDEDIKFVVGSINEIDKTECTETMETTVLGSEKINGRDCFKVERIRKTDCGFSGTGDQRKQTESQNKAIYYVDKQKRITIKFEGYELYPGGSFLLTTLELKEIKE